MHKCPCGGNFKSVRTDRKEGGKKHLYVKCLVCDMRGYMSGDKLLDTWIGRRPKTNSVEKVAVEKNLILDCSLVLQSLIRPIAGLTA